MTSRTPIRRTASSASSDSTGVPPSRAYQHAFGNTTPVSARRAGITSPAQASPQVKQRLAELRKAKLAAIAAASASESNNNTSTDEGTTPTNDGDALCDAASIRRPSSSTSSLSLEASLAAARTPSPAASEVTIELGMRSLQEEIEKAKKSGRLNVAARSLEEIPPLVFEELLPRDSIYHPSNSRPSNTISSLTRNIANVDLDSCSEQDKSSKEPADKIPWWEMESLNTLKASNNELTAVPAAVAGFESLEVLDLHANKLSTPFPANFGVLANLTSLNISNNAIEAWPIELMALVHLKMLDLSYNRLTSLWGLNWKDQVIQRMKDVKRDTKKMSRKMRGEDDADSSFDSVNSESTALDSSAGEDFWSAFSSAPVKTRARAYMPTKTDIDYKVALPSLTTLNLSHNQLSASKFSQSSIISLPPNLTNLDLSSNNLSGRIPLQLFGKLQKLKKLDLANNGLDDNFFICPSSQHATSTFEHLETLNLSRNALDSLEQLEFALRIPLERPVVYSGITSPFLVKAIAAVPPPSSSNYPTLRIDLTGNFLREELPRRKQLRRDRRQASASTAEKQSSTSTSTSDPDLTTNLVRLLDDVHCKLTRQLALRSMPTDDLERIRILLEELNSMIPGENQSAPTNTLQQTDDCTPAQMSRDAASHQTPSIVRPSIVNVSGSSRARRQRLEEQAKEWDPL